MQLSTGVAGATATRRIFYLFKTKISYTCDDLSYYEISVRILYGTYILNGKMLQLLLLLLLLRTTTAATTRRVIIYFYGILVLFYLFTSIARHLEMCRLLDNRISSCNGDKNNLLFQDRNKIININIYMKLLG